jgi:hypothetical protein
LKSDLDLADRRRVAVDHACGARDGVIGKSTADKR